MYQITVNGIPFGKPMAKEKAEAKLSRLKHTVNGLQMRRVKRS